MTPGHPSPDATAAAPADTSDPTAPHPLARSRLAVIGGSGLYDLPGLADTRWVEVATPWGAPSDAVFTGRLDTAAGPLELAFLPRHGRGHRIPPSAVNYRANLAALKRLGATEVLSLSAVGSLREDLPPGSFVVVDQFIDRTHGRAGSFFETGCVAHVSMADPVCPRLSARLAGVLQALSVRHAVGGTYLAIDGPQFSSRAESALWRAWGCDVIGMTNQPEAKLAREAELCYASVGMVTDFDCWHPGHDAVTVDAVIATLLSNTATARGVVAALATPSAAERAQPAPCGCGSALQHALITAPAARDPAVVARLRCVAARVLG